MKLERNISLDFNEPIEIAGDISLDNSFISNQTETEIQKYRKAL